MTDQYQSAGNFVLDKLELTNFDGSAKTSLRPYFVSMVLNQSIYENCIYGHVILADANGLQETFPIMGEETLRLVVRSSEDSRTISGNFKVYKLANYKERLPGEYNYTLFFTSEEFLNNEKVRVSRSYKRQSLSYIVEDVFDKLDSSKNLFIEPTVNIQHIVIANKTPLYSLNMLTGFAVSPKYSGSNFMFYEDWDGFRFECYENMLSRPVTAKYTYKASDELDPDAFTISEFKFDHTCDQLMNFSRGMYANKVIGLDLISKSTVERTFNYDDEFQDFVHTERGAKLTSPAFKDIKSHQVKLVNARSLRGSSQYFKAHNDEDSNFTKGLENVLPFRMSFEQQMQAIKANAVVPGNTDLIAGDMVELDIPPNAPGRARLDNVVHEFLSGKFLISSVAHVFSQTEHTTTITVHKDVYKKTPRNQ